MATGNMVNKTVRKGRTRTYHVINGRDVAHWGGVAGPPLVLLTIRKSLAETVVDKVIPGRF